MPLCPHAETDMATKRTADNIFFIYLLFQNINSAKLLKKNDIMEIIYGILIFNKLSLRYHTFSLPLRSK